MKVVRKKKLIFKIIFIALAAIIMVSVALVLVGAIGMKKAYFSMMNEELKIACTLMGEELEATYDGDWGGDDYTAVFKGMQLINDEYTELLDLANANTGVDYTLFYGKTRAITTIKDPSTGQRIIGTDASDSVVTTVLTNGQHFYSDNLTIAGKKYCAYYVPMKNADGSIVGMMFAGRPVDDVSKAVLRAIIIMVIIAGAITGLILALGCVVASKTSKKMSAIAGQLEKVAGGDLSVKADETLLARKDELGKIAEALNLLTDKLNSVISETKSMSLNIGNAGSELSCSSNNASQASIQISSAVDDISKGAVTQADSVQTASTNTSDIGEDIDEISSHVKELDNAAGEMKRSCDNAMRAMESLIDSNNNVTLSVQEIGRTIQSTNESAKAIDQFSEAITHIASQTNLLSLNASIEAARAGEAGQGFAVVADEIRKLADQSKESADQIKEIVVRLLADAEASVDVMKKLDANCEEQSQHLQSTKGDMQNMLDSVGSVSQSTEVISQRITRLDDEKNSLIEIVTDLSAISQENAASTQQTNASMEELSATFSIINQSAEDLQHDAEKLKELISYFS